MRSSWLIVLLLILSAMPLAAQYQQALPGYPYQFPRDHFDHPAYRTEWWYYTGNLKSADGHRFGFELTFFRQGVSRDHPKTTDWDIHDIYLAHLALSDLDGGRFYQTQRVNRAGPGLAGASEQLAKLWNGNWQVQWTTGGQELAGDCGQLRIASDHEVAQASYHSRQEWRQSEIGRCGAGLPLHFIHALVDQRFRRVKR